MFETITLTWGKPHSFVAQQRPKRIMAALKIVKPSGTQRISLSLPRNVSIGQISDAWNAQGNHWDEISLAEGNPFLAVRVIWLPKGSIVWHVFHVNDEPVDGCSYTSLTKEKWEVTGLRKLILTVV